MGHYVTSTQLSSCACQKWGKKPKTFEILSPLLAFNEGQTIKTNNLTQSE